MDTVVILVNSKDMFTACYKDIESMKKSTAESMLYFEFLDSSVPETVRPHFEFDFEDKESGSILWKNDEGKVRITERFFVEDILGE